MTIKCVLKKKQFKQFNVFSLMTKNIPKKSTKSTDPEGRHVS